MSGHPIGNFPGWASLPEPPDTPTPSASGHASEDEIDEALTRPTPRKRKTIDNSTPTKKAKRPKLHKSATATNASTSAYKPPSLSAPVNSRPGGASSHAFTSTQVRPSSATVRPNTGTTQGTSRAAIPVASGSESGEDVELVTNFAADHERRRSQNHSSSSQAKANKRKASNHTIRSRASSPSVIARPPNGKTGPNKSASSSGPGPAQDIIEISDDDEAPPVQPSSSARQPASSSVKSKKAQQPRFQKPRKFADKGAQPAFGTARKSAASTRVNKNKPPRRASSELSVGRYPHMPKSLSPIRTPASSATARKKPAVAPVRMTASKAPIQKPAPAVIDLTLDSSPEPQPRSATVGNNVAPAQADALPSPPLQDDVLMNDATNSPLHDKGSARSPEPVNTFEGDVGTVVDIHDVAAPQGIPDLHPRMSAPSSHASSNSSPEPTRLVNNPPSQEQTPPSGPSSAGLGEMTEQFMKLSQGEDHAGPSEGESGFGDVHGSPSPPTSQSEPAAGPLQQSNGDDDPPVARHSSPQSRQSTPADGALRLSTEQRALRFPEGVESPKDPPSRSPSAGDPSDSPARSLTSRRSASIPRSVSRSLSKGVSRSSSRANTPAHGARAASNSVDRHLSPARSLAADAPSPAIRKDPAAHFKSRRPSDNVRGSLHIGSFFKFALDRGRRSSSGTGIRSPSRSNSSILRQSHAVEDDNVTTSEDRLLMALHDNKEARPEETESQELVLQPQDGASSPFVDADPEDVNASSVRDDEHFAAVSDGDASDGSVVPETPQHQEDSQSPTSHTALGMDMEERNEEAISNVKDGDDAVGLTTAGLQDMPFTPPSDGERSHSDVRSADEDVLRPRAGSEPAARPVSTDMDLEEVPETPQDDSGSSIPRAVSVLPTLVSPAFQTDARTIEPAEDGDNPAHAQTAAPAQALDLNDFDLEVANTLTLRRLKKPKAHHGILVSTAEPTSPARPGQKPKVEPVTPTVKLHKPTTNATGEASPSTSVGLTNAQPIDLTLDSDEEPMQQEEQLLPFKDTAQLLLALKPGVQSGKEAVVRTSTNLPTPQSLGKEIENAPSPIPSAAPSSSIHSTDPLPGGELFASIRAITKKSGPRKASLAPQTVAGESSAEKEDTAVPNDSTSSEPTTLEAARDDRDEHTDVQAAEESNPELDVRPDSVTAPSSGIQDMTISNLAQSIGDSSRLLPSADHDISQSSTDDEEWLNPLRYPTESDGEVNDVPQDGGRRSRRRRESSSTGTQELRRSRRTSRATSASSGDPINFLEDTFDDLGLSILNQSSIQRPHDMTEPERLCDFPVISWENYLKAPVVPKYKRAKDLPHTLPDHINSMRDAYRNSALVHLMFMEMICQNTAESEPLAPRIQVFNSFDDDVSPPWEFYYTNDMWHHEDVPPPDVESLVGCDCEGRCDPKSKTCQCLKRHQEHEWSFGGFLYDEKGRLREQGYPIFECNEKCRCSDDCMNRVVQAGRKCEAHIAKMQSTGWGVIAGSKIIPKGTFLGIYAGELLTDSAGEERGLTYNKLNRTYLFDLDFHHLSRGDPEFTPRYCVDAYHAGNFTRYLNHSCNPNCHINACYINEANLEKPLLTIFTAVDVPPWHELTFSYCGDNGDEDDDGNAVMADDSQKGGVWVPCLCGAPNCKGRMWK